MQELLKFLFREAKIHNAILFFDECEVLFESRKSRSNPTLGLLLTEVRHVYKIGGGCNSKRRGEVRDEIKSVRLYKGFVTTQ